MEAKAHAGPGARMMPVMVPFLYKATVIRPRKRKEEEVVVRDEAPMAIPCVPDDAVTMVARLDRGGGRWRPYYDLAGRRMFRPLYAPDGATPLTVATLAHHLRSSPPIWVDNPLPSARADRPIGQHPARQEVERRDWLRDDRPERVSDLATRARRLLAADGVLYGRVVEPMWLVLPGAVGGPASVRASDGSGVRPEMAALSFRADRRAEAIAFAAALGRGAEPSVGGGLEVLRPDLLRRDDLRTVAVNIVPAAVEAAATRLADLPRESILAWCDLRDARDAMARGAYSPDLGRAALDRVAIIADGLPEGGGPLPPRAAERLREAALRWRMLEAATEAERAALGATEGLAELA